MARTKGASLSSIFDDDDVADTAPAPQQAPVAVETPAKAPQPVQRASKAVSAPKVSASVSAALSAKPGAKATPSGRKDSHPGKKPVLIHIPEDMHRILRQLSVEEGGEPITQITERGLRQYLVQRGYTKFAAR